MNSDNTPPKQQIEQPQPQISAGGAARDGEGLPAASISVAHKHSEQEGKAARPLDEARFNAGIIKLYETIQNEPVPDEITALIDKLAKREQS